MWNFSEFRYWYSMDFESSSSLDCNFDFVITSAVQNLVVGLESMCPILKPSDSPHLLLHTWDVSLPSIRLVKDETNLLIIIFMD